LKVGVIGAGPAGIEASTAAAERGASVTLLEASNTLTIPKNQWPLLLKGEKIPLPPNLSLRSHGVRVRLAAEVVRVSSDLKVSLSGRSEMYDSIVIATGGRFVLPPIPGVAKRGVHPLTRLEAFHELRDSREHCSRFVVMGGGHAGLDVSDALASQGALVTLVTGGHLLPNLSRSVRDLVMSYVAARGIKIVEGSIDSIVGSERVEAVLVDGDVLPCDCLAIVPRIVASYPLVGARVGPHGGLIVDSRMKTSAPRVFAAGDCVEYLVGNSSRTIMLSPAARACGKVAGIGASGGRVALTPVGCFSKRLFGLSICTAGLALGEARSLGFEATEAMAKVENSGAASVVFSRATGRILGLQQAGPTCVSPELLATIIATEMTVEELRCAENSGSTDISLIVQAASEGVRK
jgi:NADPH-dependent 2,4-dienoyl-CoA reductase/sulfur reductase-like enzyme